jgi:hypothetical protein
LQHPGHFFYLAALAAIDRKNRFHQVIDAQEDGVSDDSAALKHEKAVNHVEQIIDVRSLLRLYAALIWWKQLLTKSYEAFKRYKATRTSLAIVALIAASQLQAEKHDVALK